MSQANNQVMLPIKLSMDYMKRLLVSSFKGDHEFEAFEPQVFDDPINGKGMRVICYRKDKKVDIYYQPGVRVDKETFVIGDGIGEMMETIIEPSRFEISENGVDLHVVFTDVKNRKIELQVHENAPGKQGFPLLAPIGADIKNPTLLFLVYMPDISLLWRRATKISAQVGDRVLRPASLPLIMNGHRVWFTRCAPSITIANINPPMNEPIIATIPASGIAEVNGMQIITDNKQNITALRSEHNEQIIEMTFSPGFPNLLTLPNGKAAVGHWDLRISEVLITGGSYSVSRNGESIPVEIDVTEPWKPSGLPFSMRIFTRILSFFRTWPTSYRWRGVVDLSSKPAMSGRWERKKK